MKAQLLRHVKGVHRFDFAVTLCIIGILATLLMHSLNKAQYEIEKRNQETELNNIRLGLMEAWVHKSVSNQLVDAEALKDGNPMLLIAEVPANYIGERSGTAMGSKDIWYFNTRNKRLIYVFNDEDQLDYRLVSTTGQPRASLMSVGSLDLMLVIKKDAVTEK